MNQETPQVPLPEPGAAVEAEAKPDNRWLNPPKMSDTPTAEERFAQIRWAIETGWGAGHEGAKILLARYDALAETLAHREQQVREAWVSVEDRLPEYDEAVWSAHVLVALQNGFVLTAQLLSAGRWFFPALGHAPAEDNPITHWMPLPTPPATSLGIDLNPA